MVKIRQSLLDREKEVRPYIEKYAHLFKLDPNLIRAVISQESRFVAEAVSPTGAYGLGQFTAIGARQVQNISRMTAAAADLSNFTKREADEADQGVKAICATFWWLLYRKYGKVTDKKIQLEAATTFYNSGGRPAALVIKHGGHAQAVEAIKQLSPRYQSQSVTYAPEVTSWFIAWHDYFERLRRAPAVKAPIKVVAANPFDEVEEAISPTHRALIKILQVMSLGDDSTDCIVNSRDGLTEVTLIFTGELE